MRCVDRCRWSYKGYHRVSQQDADAQKKKRTCERKIHVRLHTRCGVSGSPLVVPNHVPGQAPEDAHGPSLVVVEQLDNQFEHLAALRTEARG
jgi:hypothetical protein